MISIVKKTIFFSRSYQELFAVGTGIAYLRLIIEKLFSFIFEV